MRHCPILRTIFSASSVIKRLSYANDNFSFAGMGNYCSCLRASDEVSSRTLEVLLTFPEIKITSNPIKDKSRRTWDYVETSSSLLTTFPSFPRGFTHSNNCVDVILANTLRRLCKDFDADQKRAKSFEWYFRYTADSAKDREGASDDSPYSRTHYFHSSVYFQLARWLGRAPNHPAANVATTVDPTDVTDAAASLAADPYWTAVVDGFGTATFYRGLFGHGLTNSGPEVLLAIMEEEADCWTPAAVFEAVVKAVRTNKVVIDDDGRAIITHSRTRKRLGPNMVDHVQRILTHGWCQMLHNQVRLCVITSHESTIVFYIDHGRVEVLDLPPKYGEKTSLAPVTENDISPTGLWCCEPRPVTREKQKRQWWNGSYHRFVGDKLPEYDFSLSFTSPPTSRKNDLGAQGDMQPVKDTATLYDIGPPSLHIVLSAEYDLKRVRDFNVSHSLLTARKWPDLLHGPIDLGRLDGQGLPQLISETSEELPAKGPKAKLTNGLVEHVFRPQVFLLGESIGMGAFWDVFRIRVPPHLPQPPFPLVGKVIATSCFKEVADPPSNIWNPLARARVSQAQAREHIRKEYQILSRLSEIDPPVSPKLMGLWGGIQGGKEVWIIVMEDAGERINKPEGEERSFKRIKEEADKEAILNLYARLHEQGILHGDVQMRHWCRRNEDRLDSSAIRLIDFDRAILRSSVSEEIWNKYKKREQTTLKGILSEYDYHWSFPPLPSSADGSEDEDVDSSRCMTEAVYPLGYVKGKVPELYDVPAFDPLGYGDYNPWA
ncbi:hypothetical protein M231_03499 [Tremella mesenterica]|uniref:Protein kinase domain-containing protein n=1 Tax=Tremella mesenterica TaxID=5217 RepID=A0A4Q1BN54_TREME|nr:hypothetical protein M231_03499 [Tremella mesenterica]